MKTIVKKIFLVESFYGGSHQSWIDGLRKNSRHEIVLFTLKNKYWKWRMHGGAISLALEVNQENNIPDLFLCSDMMDVALFKSLLKPDFQNIPISVYFHENQLTYPWNSKLTKEEEEKKYHYSFINYTTALVSDRVLFNSTYHMNEFMEALPRFLKMYPNPKNLNTIEKIRSRSSVLHLALDFPEDVEIVTEEEPIIVWNHRMEYDKNPLLFFGSLVNLMEEGISFKIIILGEEQKSLDRSIAQQINKLKERTLYSGYASSRSEYWKWLSKANIIPITSNQDFFGISLMEGIYSGAYPIIPNRLAFPELLKGKEYYYDTEIEFLNKLRDVITHKKYLHPSPDLLDQVDAYSWKNSIDKYDTILSQ